MMNWMDGCFNGVSAQPASIGPLWIIAPIAGVNFIHTAAQFSKLINAKWDAGTASEGAVSGRIFVVGATSLAQSAGGNAVDLGMGKRITNLAVRNCILTTRASGGDGVFVNDAGDYSPPGDGPGGILVPGGSETNSDYNLTSGWRVDRPISGLTTEGNGVEADSVDFVNDTGDADGDYRLDTGSDGKGVGQQIKGVTIPGEVNPDMGIGGIWAAMPTIGTGL